MKNLVITICTAVSAINNICIKCNISIPVGKDSLSMSATKVENNTSKKEGLRYH